MASHSLARPGAIQRGIYLLKEHDELLRRVRDELSARIGRAGYASAVVYGLTLAAAHLGIDAPPPIPLPPAPPDR